MTMGTKETDPCAKVGIPSLRLIALMWLVGAVSSGDLPGGAATATRPQPPLVPALRRSDSC